MAKRFCVDGEPARNTHRRVIIATVPDPELTHLALMFDRQVESIAWAAADGNGGADPARGRAADYRYTFESYWFPWNPEAGERETEADSTAARRDERLSQPGLLLFHGLNDPNELLFILLVGETPASGVNRTAFRRAWGYAAELKTDALPICPSADCVGIVGPSFSGSLQGFGRLLQDLKDEALHKKDGDPEKVQYARHVLLISGSTTSPPDIAKRDFHFCTAVANDRDAIQAILTYKRAVHWSGESNRVAFLVEAETGFGAEASSQIEKLAPDWLMLRYPRGIATIRNSSARELPEVSNAAPQPGAEVPDLPLSLRDHGKDSIPALSDSQTPVSQEAVLLEIASTVKRENTNYVAILGTEPLDALFLTKFVHAAAPNTRVFIAGADLLYARTAQKWNLDGTIAVSTYPLLSRNQNFAGSHPPRRVQFASETAEGEYNACRRMLLPSANQPDDAPDPSLCNSDLKQDPKDPQDFLLDYASPFATLDASHSHKPPLWIMVLGRDAWWPVAAYDHDQLDSRVHPTLFQGPEPAAHAHEKFTVEQDPPVWYVFFGITWALCAAHVLIVERMNSRYRRLWWRSWRLRTLAWAPDGNLNEIRRSRFYLALATLVVAVASGLLLATLIGTGDIADRPWQFSLALIVFAAAILELAWAAWGGSHRVWIAIVAVITLTLVARIAMPVVAGYLTPFAAYRAIHVEGGTSPLLPALILLLALYCFLWFRLKQLRNQEDHMPSLPNRELVGLDIGATNVEHLSPEQQRLIISSAFAAFVVWFVLFLPLKALAMLERPAYRLLIILLVSLVIYLLVWSVSRFVAAWGQLRRLLQALERHPVRYAFSRLPKCFSWTATWTSGDPSTLFTQSRAIDVLKKIFAGRAEFSAVEGLLNAEQNPDRDYRLHRCAPNLEMILNLWLRFVVAEQRPAWDAGSVDSISSREDKDKVPEEWHDHELSIAREEFVALRYVAFIRFGMRQMRSTFEFLGYGFILLVIALNIYPFRGNHEIDVVLVVAFVLVAIATIAAFARMDRDPLLSRLNDTKPNELSGTFVWRVISFGSLPFLTLVASLVPQVGSFLTSWVQPTLQALK